MTVITGRLKVLAATASIVVLTGMALPAQAGGLGGVVGGVAGAVGGVVDGAKGAVGGVVGGSGAMSTGSDSQGASSSNASSNSSDGGVGPTHYSNRSLVKLKANVLGVKAGVYVLDNYGHLVRINARIADH